MRGRSLKIILAIIFLSFFFVILYYVITNRFETIDNKFYQQVAKKINHKNTFVMKGITFLGSTVGIILFLFLSFFYIKHDYDRLYIIISMLGEVALNTCIKMIVKRIRPSINPLVKEKSHSFPSGHSMASTVCYGLLCFFLWISPFSLFIKIIGSILMVLVTFSVMFSRVYLGVHYFSDVIAGFCCGLSYLFFIISFYFPIQYLFY